jgi:hydroxyacylglutathione hydrolase
MLSIKSFTFNEFSENTFVVHDSKHCIIVDPGCYRPSEVEELRDYILTNNLKPQAIWNTHCHIDHILGVGQVKGLFKIPFLIGRKETDVLRSMNLFASYYGYQGFEVPESDGFIEEGQNLVLGSHSWEVLDVPGHSPGHIALFNREELVCISGDVLFYRSIGRSDLPGGDHDQLIRSIRTKLFTLPEVTRVLPGHGHETSVGDEKIHNPFCGEMVD